jgi:predicted nuclease of predicted toxin-antitoxin system
LDDARILELAEGGGRILITNDKDFGDLVFRQKLVSAGVILLRMKGATGAEKAEAVRKLLKRYGRKLRGNFVVVTAKKCRFAPIKGWF